MLDPTRNLPNSKSGCLWNDHAGGSFHYFSTIGPAGSYDFEVALLFFFPADDVRPANVCAMRHDEPLQTMAYTLFGLLYVLWLFNFHHQDRLPDSASQRWMVTGQFYVLYLIAVTKFSDMERILPAALIGRHLMGSADQRQEKRGKIFRRARFCPGLQFGLVQIDADIYRLLSWTHATILGLLLASPRSLASGRVDHQTKHRGKDSGKPSTGNRGAARLIDSLLFTAPFCFFICVL